MLTGQMIVRDSIAKGDEDECIVTLPDATRPTRINTINPGFNSTEAVSVVISMHPSSSRMDREGNLKDESS